MKKVPLKLGVRGYGELMSEKCHIEQRHNSIIKFDLHIHSKASAYKEEKGIVENSNKENISVLLSALNSHEVALFSITDHNRFDSDLYLKIEEELSRPNNPYPNVRTVLAGIEFDVKIEEDMEKCHIIAIFDTMNDSTKLVQIETKLEEHLLTGKDECYNKEEFETVLKSINLDVILIASQRKGLHSGANNQNSLSDSTKDVEATISVGYIQALEFQKPKIEGILKDNLKNISAPVPLLSGSDCHDWRYYPNHDKNNKNTEFYHSKARMLPTFRGLLMAITSPDTRFNYRENKNQFFFHGIKVGEQEVQLVNGINAIIGENGSGKTTLLKLITGDTKCQHVSKLVRDNDLSINDSIDSNKIKNVSQGQIIEEFNKSRLSSLGDNNNFPKLDSSYLNKIYSDYASKIKEYIRATIEKEDAIIILSTRSITFDGKLTGSTYYVTVDIKEDFSTVNNPHKIQRDSIDKLIKYVREMISKDYYSQYESILNNIVVEFNEVRSTIHKDCKKQYYESKVKNAIYRYGKEYNGLVEAKATAKDKDTDAYNKSARNLAYSVTDAIKKSVKVLNWPDEPPTINGMEKQSRRGFNFNTVADYNGRSVVDDFYQKMFTKNYRTPTSLKSIDTLEKFTESVMNCGSNCDIESAWNTNFDKFIAAVTLTKTYITEGENKVGNTLGELSLSYYKFLTQDEGNWNVFIIDQPEDNISNNNISVKLIEYFRAIRDKKQLIFVTHNPLLVVNLDVDNVIHVRNDSGKISIVSGCLEYEDERINILESIAQDMDGGKEAIKKRLRMYG